MQDQLHESLLKYLQDDQTAITDECKQLLRSLPVEKGWRLPFVHRYQGFWYTTSYINGTLLAQRHFKAVDSDILLVTAPKSGTTWLKALLFALTNRSNLHPVNKPDHLLLLKNPHDLVPCLELKLYLKDSGPDLLSFTSPRLFATHLPFVSLPESVKESVGCKLVYLCRNPKDTFVSLWHFLNNLSVKDMGGPVSLEDGFDKFCRGVSAFRPYWDHVLGYYEASRTMPDKVLFLKYEEMKENPSEQLRRLADFLGCPFSKEEEEGGAMDKILRLCSFGNLSKLEVNMNEKLSTGEDNSVFFRKGEVGDWVNYLSPEMAERIDRITEDKLRASGLKL